MSDIDPPPVVVTRVGLSLFGDNAFRGRSMNTEIVGVDGFWSMISQAIDGPRLDSERERCMSDVAVCAQAADPRVWPLKLARLVSSYGSSIGGLCAAMLSSEAAFIGPWSATGAAMRLVALEKLDAADLERRVHELLGAGERFVGYGVPLRPVDERVVKMRSLIPTRYPSIPGKYWVLAHDLERILFEARGVHMNIGAAVGALCLDLGFSPEQIGPLSVMHATSSFLAHSWEGSQQRAEVLQQLPSRLVEYVGPPPRRSARATASNDDGEQALP